MGAFLFISIVAIGAIGWSLAIMSEYKSILSPLGMLTTTVALTLMLNPFFGKGDGYGYFMVFMTVFYLGMTIRAFQLYFRLNKEEI